MLTGRTAIAFLIIVLIVCPICFFGLIWICDHFAVCGLNLNGPFRLLAALAVAVVIGVICAVTAMGDAIEKWKLSHPPKKKTTP